MLTQMFTYKPPEVPQNLSLIRKVKTITNPLETLEQQARIYGDIFTIAVSSSKNSQVVISNPECIEKIFTADLNQLDSGEEAGIKLPLLGQNSLLALSGDRHPQFL
ncbi:MAG: hypothetical protein ACFCUV_16800 [Rivularia sp. (in: cyanobacteria)]